MNERGSKLVKLMASAVVLAVAGCSLLVSGDVPEFDCSGTEASACASGFVCDEVSRRCVAASTVVPNDGGEEDSAIDPGDAMDSGEGGDPLALGSRCRINDDCKSRLCGSSTILTPAITQATGPICTTPCCTSTECPSSFVCFNGGTGGGYCVPATLAERTPPASGGKGGGMPCTAGTQCRSGLCGGNPKVCVDTCCAASECAGPTTCRLASIAAPGPAHDIWACVAPEVTGTKAAGQACGSPDECATDNCIGFGTSVCRPPCSNTASCKSIAAFASGQCIYGSTGNDFFKFCSTTTPAVLPAGSKCSDKSECQSDYCDAELKTCANVCAKDSDCAPKEACRPSPVNTPLLRCAPKPP